MTGSGPLIVVHGDLSRYELGAGDDTGDVSLIWPRAGFVSGLLLLPLSGSDADLAALALRLRTGSREDLITDGRSHHQVLGYELAGSGRRWFELQIPVRSGDEWIATVTNQGAGTLAATLLYRVEPPEDR